MTRPDTATAADLRCYVVNLRRRQDRRARISAQIPTELPVIYTSDWDGPFDGHSLTAERVRQAGFELWPWRIESNNPWWNRPLKYGEIGCTLAHLACWRDAVLARAQYTVVLEDDAVLPPTFLDDLLTVLRRLGSPAPFDLLYLGRIPLTPDQPTGPLIRDLARLVVPGYSHCTFGYLLTCTGLGAVLGAGLESAIVPVDEFLPALYHPHPRPDLRCRFPPRLRALAFDPPLVTQRPKADAGSDTEDSGFVDDAQPSLGI